MNNMNKKYICIDKNMHNNVNFYTLTPVLGGDTLVMEAKALKSAINSGLVEVLNIKVIKGGVGEKLLYDPVTPVEILIIDFWKDIHSLPDDADIKTIQQLFDAKFLRYMSETFEYKTTVE